MSNETAATSDDLMFRDKNWSVFLAQLAEFLNNQKASDVCVRYFAGDSAVADAMLIATATSKRHASGLADGIEDLCRQAGRRRPRMEGYAAADWILVDCGDIIVHIFQKDIRDLYKLEDLWNARPEKELAQ